MDVNFVVGLSHFSGKIAIFQKKIDVTSTLNCEISQGGNDIKDNWSK